MAPISYSKWCKNVIVVSLKVPFLNKYISPLWEATYFWKKIFQIIEYISVMPQSDIFWMNDFCQDVFGGLKIGGLKNLVAPSSDFHLVRPL